jgi:hypothetical protein
MSTAKPPIDEQQAAAHRPIVGNVYPVPHEDYRFGHGCLIAIVDEVLREVVFDNSPWWLVRVRWKSALSSGITAWRGSREMYVRVSVFGRRED